MSELEEFDVPGDGIDIDAYDMPNVEDRRGVVFSVFVYQGSCLFIAIAGRDRRI